MPRSAVAAALALVLGWPLQALAANTDKGDSEAEASSAETAKPPLPPRVFDLVMVTGGPERVDATPGSAHYLDAERLESQQYSDIHRLLREIPGINVQEEDGYGLRPNIGMRGSGVERSAKITLLEDGTLIAPAPYSAPAAYYFPTPARMQAVEVRKGSSAVQQGPFTLGGVLNLVSTSIPAGSAGRVSLSLGDDGSGRLHANVGRSGSRFGWLLETYQLQADGFKRLDGGGPTGVELADYLVKLRWNGASQARRQQAFELKLGRTDQLADETYLGLTLDDFRRTPLRRYAASAADYLDSEHYQLQLRYLAQMSPRIDLSATLYDNRFGRNWHKLQSVNGVALSSVLEEPDSHPGELSALRGELDLVGGGLAVRNNRRDYSSRGFEAVVGIDLGKRLAQRLEIGLRLHHDEEDRFQEDDRWNIEAGRMTPLELGAPGSQANRVTAASVRALYLQDEIRAGRWTLAPGLRFERIEFERRDFAGPARLDAPRIRRNGVDVFIPGLGVTYRLGQRWHLLGGAYKGFAPPGAGRDGSTRAEESLNLEAGFRFRGRQLHAELVAFENDYDNLLGRDTLSTGGGGTGELFNGGAVLVRGLEASVERSFRAAGGSVIIPLRFNYTLTRGRFLTSFNTDFADWGPEVAAGDRLPYLPEHQLLVTTGVSRGAWNGYLGVSLNDAMRTEPGRGRLEAGSATDSYTVTDLSIERRWGSTWRLFARVRNLTDETYIVALRPAGARPGLPRTLLLGATWNF